MSNGTLTPDLCILGAGEAGPGIAIAAASLGLQVAFVRDEKGARTLAPPSRQLRLLCDAGAAAAGVRHAAGFGLTAERHIDFVRVRERMLALADDLALNETDERLRAFGVRTIRASGRFTDSGEVTAGGFDIRARRFLLVPKLEPVVPPARGLARAAYLGADNLFSVKECPGHLVVIGAGATGLAAAQAFRRLGATVTVLDTAEPLVGEDRECAAILLASLAAEGVEVRSGVEIMSVDGKKGALRVSVRDGEGETVIDATHVLVAVGWKPVLDSFSLEAAGIDGGAESIRAGAPLRTANSRVSVAANGPEAVAADEWCGRRVIAHLMFRWPLRADPALAARATLTDPAIARVGLREDEAREKHRDIRVLRAPFSENEGAVAARKTNGMVKLVTTRSGRLVGASIVGTRAEELIAHYALALSRKLNLRSLAEPVFPASSFGGAGQQAALAGVGAGLTKPWVRRIIATMRLFG